ARSSAGMSLTRVPSILLAFIVLSRAQDEIIDELGSEGSAILSESRIKGVFVRQCSCEEQLQCTEEMKKQADSCTYPCFSHFNKITDKPDDLRQCFDDKLEIVDNFINCFSHRVDSCVNHQNGPMIPKTSIASIFTNGEQRLNKPPTGTLAALIAPIKHYLDAAGVFATCVKDCFIEKNRDGYCFDRLGCQPLISDAKAQASLRTCTKRMQWKRQAGEVCECSVNAGLTDLKQYCSMFKLMARRSGNHRTHG
ncbi:hypothetical protein PMAYCL1PPCAC_15489, partial [Pristionchus mayeri]